MTQKRTKETQDVRSDRTNAPGLSVLSADEMARTARYDETLARLKTLLIEQLHLRREPDEIDPDAALFGIGLALDSIDAVELTVAVENVFGVKVPDGERSRTILRTVSSLVSHIAAAQEAPQETAHVA